MRSGALRERLSRILLATGVSALLTLVVSPLLFVGSAARSANVHDLPLVSVENAYAALPLFGVSAGVIFITLAIAAAWRHDA